jgi:hypothetical protein
MARPRVTQARARDVLFATRAWLTLIERDLIVEVHERPAPELDDERRRYYRMTRFGEAVARAETRRLQGLVRLARARGFVPKGA